MTEEKVPYLNDTTTTKWADVRFPNGRHTGVRVLRGTTIIEVMRDGCKMIVDISDSLPLDLTVNKAYNG